MTDRDDEALDAALIDRYQAPRSIRHLTSGLGARRQAWGPARADGELIGAVHGGAACKGVDNMTEVLYQDEALPYRSMCEACPVRELCLWLGRDTWGWGVWGGVALVAGRFAAEEPASEEERAG